jgi:hypothetical protein
MSNSLALQGQSLWRDGRLANLAYWDPDPSHVVNPDGTYTAHMDYTTSGTPGYIERTFVLDRTVPALSLRKTLSGNTVTVSVDASEPLLQRDFISHPVSFRPGPGNDVVLSEGLVTTDLAVHGKHLYTVWQECLGTGAALPCDFEVLFAKSDDYGQTWGSPLQLTQSGRVFAPAIAVGDRCIYVFFQDSVGILTGELYFSRSCNGGAPGSWEDGDGNPANDNVDHAARLTLGGGNQASGGWPFIFPQAVASGLGVHVIWEDFRNGRHDIYYLRSLSEGGTNPWTWEDGDPNTNNIDNARQLTKAGISWVSNIDLSGGILTATFLNTRDDPANTISEVYMTHTSNPSAPTQVWDDGDGNPANDNVDHTRRLTTDQAAVDSGAWPHLEASGVAAHIVFGHRMGNPPLLSASYIRSMDSGATWDGGLGTGTYRVLHHGIALSGDIYPTITGTNGLVRTAWIEVGGAPLLTLDGKSSTDSGTSWTTPLPLTDPDWGVIASSPISIGSATDPLGGHHFVWTDMFGRNRFLYYGLDAVPMARITAPDGSTSLTPLTGSGQAWSLAVATGEQGLYTAEIAAYDKAGNLARKVAYFGNLEFAASGGLTQSLALDQGWAFQESRMGLSSLPDLSERTEQTDQVNDAVLDIFAYVYFEGHRQGQGFQPSSTRLSSADLLLSRTTGFTSDLVVEVQSDVGGLPSGTVLTSARILNSQVTTTAAWIHVDLPDIPTSGNLLYDLIVRADPEPSPCVFPNPCEQFRWARSGDSGDDVYPRGTSLWYSGTWSAGGSDHRFKTWSNALSSEALDQANAANPPPPRLQGSYTEATAQSFQPAANELASADVRIAKGSNYPFDLLIDVVNNGAGNLPGTTVLARAYLQNENIPTSFAWVRVDFANVVLTPGTTYHLVLRPGGAGSCPPPPSTYCWYQWETSADIYSRGRASRMQSGVWGADDGDRLFKVSAANLDADSADQTTGSAFDSSTGLFWGSEPIAQGFQPSSATISRIDLYLSKTTDLNWNLALSLVADDGTGLPGTQVLAGAVLTPAALPLAAGWVPVDIADVGASPSSTYHIVIQPSSSGELNPAGSVSWYVNSLNEYVRGRASYRSGGTWYPLNPMDRLLVSYTSDRTAEVDDQQLDVAVAATPRQLAGSTVSLAQSFVPTAEVVSSARLLLARSSTLMTSDLVIEIQGSLIDGSPNGVANTRVTVPASQVPTAAPSFVTADFSDTPATPGTRLHVVLTTRLPVPNGQWVSWSLIGPSDYYVPGAAWASTGTWSAIGGDFEFYVRGADSGPIKGDQSQLSYNAIGMPLSTGTQWGQSFRPSHPILTGLDVVIDQTGTFSGGVIVEIQTALGGVPSGTAILRSFIASTAVPSSPSAVSVSFPDLVVDAASNYFVVLYLSGPGIVRWEYHRAQLDAYREAYGPGYAATRVGGTWSTLPLDDFAFQTYGKSYARVVTNPSVQLAPNFPGPVIWSYAGEYYGPTATNDFAAQLTFYVSFEIPDSLGYVHVQFLFSSTSRGNLFEWAERLALA